MGETKHAKARTGSATPAWFAKLRANRKAMALAISAIVVLLVALGTLGYMLWVHVLDMTAARKMAALEKPSTSIQVKPENKEGDEKAPMVIDFASLQAKNPEIIAWLYVPGTDVNLPLVQHTGGSDEYYLTHDAFGKYSPLGAAFSEGINSPSFNDPVTVVYGHDAKSIFKNLHYFEDDDFFNQHDTMYVYLPNGKLQTYSIVSAYRSDDSYILGKQDFSTESGRNAYFKEVLNPPASEYRQVRDGASLNSDDRLLQLSTCMLNEFHGSHRYIVTGALISEEQQVQ